MVWKLYIDSRRRVKGSRGDSDSSFAVALPYPITASGKAFIDVCLICNSFYTIRTGENDKIYLDELVGKTKRVITLEAGQYQIYELKDALVVALNGIGKLLTGQYACTYVTSKNRFEL